VPVDDILSFPSPSEHRCHHRSLDLKMSGDGVSGKRPALTHTMGLQEFSVTSEDSPSPVTCPYVSSLCFVTEGGSKSESFSCMVLEFYTLF
jgi:hypothetical protein